MTSFILKVAVITPTYEETLPTIDERVKLSESAESYLNEAQIQQFTWKKSITGGRPAICPPVANLTFFDKMASKAVVTLCRNRSSGPNATMVFEYLQNIISDTHTIGIITMPTIPNSNMLSTSLRHMSTPDKYEAVAYTMAQFIKMFIEIGVIHFDVHAGNILIHTGLDGHIHSTLIDFGRTADLNRLTDEIWLTVDDVTDINFTGKRSLLKYKAKASDMLLNLYMDSDLNKIKYIKGILNLLLQLYEIVTIRENFPSNALNWIRPYLSPEVMLLAYNILYSLVISRGKLLPSTIDTFTRNGDIFNLESDDISVYTEIGVIPSNSISITGKRKHNTILTEVEAEDTYDVKKPWWDIWGGRKRASKSMRKTKTYTRNRLRRKKRRTCRQCKKRFVI